MFFAQRVGEVLARLRLVVLLGQREPEGALATRLEADLVKRPKHDYAGDREKHGGAEPEAEGEDVEGLGEK